ncbi:STAS/SEC14 domain-containing protein [Fulvivirga sp. 29W222]|uniref:STAS/SEC14 domain-containing protein n=1 Tax=Fulvivirga marina TaxID=2494733 RepID=A0A937FX63_9BACT|nr:STAS/SEC14 domain-containing protein [Fulvivirga marina]MBL6446025.1 STAS/SEC14 domain-containing protein [Fulvivirga marina]
MKLLLEHDKANLQFNEETNSIELIWKKYHDEASYRLMFTQGVKLLKEYGATGWLSDIRKEGVVGPTISSWMQKEILPVAIANGLKKVAIVMDADVFKEFYVKNIERNVAQGIMKYFDSVEAAHEWLKG